MTSRTLALASTVLVSFSLVAAPACAAPAGAGVAKAGISAEDWGTTQKGDKVELFTLTGKGGMVAKIANFGGVVVDLIVPDRNGKPTNVVLGYDDLASYEKGGVYSALIGPYANRLGLQFPIDGRMYQQPTPTPRPVPAGAPVPPVRKFIQHSGANGFQKRVWEAVMHDGAEPSLSLTIKNPDGIGGMPGNVTVTVTYTVRADNTLVLDYKGATDKPTVMNLTNHFYFTLNGGVKNIDDQKVTVFANRYTPYDVDADTTSGVVASVAGSPYDFTKPTRIGDRMPLVSQPVGAAKVPGYDAYFLVDGRAGRMRRAAQVSDPDTGIVMVTSTTEPGVQLYTDNIVGQVKGRNGAVYGNHWAISLETGKAPDTPNHPNFPSAEVTPAKPLHETTEYRFGTLR
jgi:aldose 1-epimerase